jgi:mono/diheme cytochrome c family protein
LPFAPPPPLPDGILAWDTASKTVEATNGQGVARLIYNFTNLSTNEITILNARPSCGCTTVEMPPVPWRVAARATGQIKMNVNLSGKVGTLFKSVNVATDKGSQRLELRINISPPVVVPLTEAQRAAGIAAAKVDRQAVFKGDCAACHRKNVLGQFGQPLFAATCAICHEADPRATMVPDLHHLTDAAGQPIPTNEEFWRALITAGKANTLMPAFAVSQGGPLNDIQIASLAAYLNAAYPSRVPPASPK